MNITKCCTITRMKTKLIAALGDDKLEHKENIVYPHIYVVDYTQKTNSARSIEICNI